MWKYTLQVEGMMCGMCEAHVNESIRREFPNIKKVSSSHGKNQTVVIAEDELDEQKLSDAITATGYDVKGIEKEPYKKKLFGW